MDERIQKYEEKMKKKTQKVMKKYFFFIKAHLIKNVHR